MPATIELSVRCVSHVVNVHCYYCPFWAWQCRSWAGDEGTRQAVVEGAPATTTGQEAGLAGRRATLLCYHCSYLGVTCSTICLCPRPVVSSTSAHRLVCQRASAVRLRSLCFFLTHPPTQVTGAPGSRGVAVAASSSGAGSGGLQGTRAGASVREQAQSALIQC